MLDGARRKYKTLFHRTELDNKEYQSELDHDNVTGYRKIGEDESMTSSKEEGDRGDLEEQVDQNTGMTHENRYRIVRIDERTAFIAKIVFVLFLGFLASVAAGIVVALL